MLEYIVLYLLFGALSLIGSFATEDQKDSVHRIQNAICFLAVLLLLVCRHQSMGIDLHWKGVRSDDGYLPFFDYVVKFDKISLRYFLEESSWFSYERGFMVYTWLIHIVSSSRQFFMAVTATVSLLPIWLLFRKKSTDPVLSWVIFLSLSPFLLLYSGLRQGIVIGLAALMYILVEDRKLIWFLIVGALAFTFHESAVLLVAIYPLMHLKLNRTARTVSLCVIALVFIFMKRIVAFMVDLFPQYEYMFSGNDAGAYRYFLVMLAIYVICAMGTDGSPSQNAYMNLYFMACVFQMLGLISEVAPRAGFYFMPALCILLPDVIANIRVKENAALLRFGSAVCFSLWGLYSIYSTSWAMAYPYHWFWEAVA